jgi:hypothetical protein
MDTKIETVISSISGTVTNAIKTQIESMENKISRMVADAISTQSGTLVTQVAHSPFVTGARLQSVLDNFISKINIRIDHLSETQIQHHHLGNTPKLHRTDMPCSWTLSHTSRLLKQ